MKKLICFLLAFISLGAFCQRVYIPESPIVGTSKATIPCEYNFPSGIKSIQWKTTYGPNVPVLVTPNAETLIVEGLINGNYRFDVTVVDNAGGTYTDWVPVVVDYVVQLPVPEPIKKDTVIIYKDSCFFDWGKTPLQLTLLLPEPGGSFMLPDSITAHRALFGAAPPHVRLKNDTSIIAYRRVEGQAPNRRRITGYTTGAFVVEMVINGKWEAVNQRLRNGTWVNY